MQKLMQTLSLQDYQRYLNPFFIIITLIPVLLADNRILLVIPCVLLVHWYYSYPGELRFIAQVMVIGWLFNAIVFRSELIGHGQAAPLWLLMFWFSLAIGICHGLKHILRSLKWVPLIGAVIVNGIYTTVCHINGLGLYEDFLVFGLVSSLIWALAFTLIVFIASTRVISLAP